MTDLIKHLKEAGEGRTPGPWRTQKNAILGPDDYDGDDHFLGTMSAGKLDYRVDWGASVYSTPGQRIGLDNARFIAFMGTHYEEILAALIAGQEAIERVEELEADAQKWRGLMACDRIRHIGRGQHNYMCFEFWPNHPAKHPSADYPQDDCRKDLADLAARSNNGEG